MKKEIEIEEWINKNLSDICEYWDEEDLLEKIFPLILFTDNKIVKNCNLPEELITIGLMWIKGENYIDIQKYCAKKNIQTKQRRKIDIFSLQQVVGICDEFFGYECTLVLAAIIENINYSCDDAELTHCFKLLSKRMRYGLSTQCAISLYEMGFNDRVIATQISTILESNNRVENKKDIKKVFKRNRNIQERVLHYLKDYPSYFYERVKKLMI